MQGIDMGTGAMDFIQPYQNIPTTDQHHGFQGFPYSFHGQHAHMTSTAPAHMAPVIPAHMKFTPGTNTPQGYPSPAPLPITEWLSYCDTIPIRKEQSGVQFTGLSDTFEREGINRLEQLNGDIVTVRELAECLSIKFGPASDIMRYAQADLAAILAGQLVIPSTKN
jgi:hypothetical protein